MPQSGHAHNAAPARFPGFSGRRLAQCLGMMKFTDLASVPSDHPTPFIDQLRLAVAAYLARFKGSSREHTESDLRCYLSWCGDRTWSCTSGGCRRSAGSSPPRCRGGSQ
jgi:hypothetical protein